jgi:hypothetical protein
MTAFLYETNSDPVRTDLAEAHRRAWDHIARPGTWLTGAERVAVADETRRARDCALCRERKAALSPYTVEGSHDHAGLLSDAMVDEIHRVTTDAARLTEKWQNGLVADGLSIEAYVEVLGVAVIAISVDRFHHAMGFALEALPAPIPGEPTRERPNDIVEGEAWVPMMASAAIAKLVRLPASQAPYVIRALSLVPAEVLAWGDLSDAQYIATDDMLDFGSTRALDRSQIELVAGRVSALNECFY